MRFVTYLTPVARPASRCLAGLLSVLMIVTPVVGQSTADSSTSSQSIATKPTGTKTKKTAKATPKGTRTAGRSARRARTARIKLAFVASTELRPMAQQLAMLRTPAAYKGVTDYAHKHTGEAAAAAYLALGHAYLADKHFSEAVTNLRLARQSGQELADYADFLAAEANHNSGNQAAAEALLKGFAARYPDSIFDAEAPELEANTLLAMNDLSGARQMLAAASNTASANRPGFQLAEGQVLAGLGQTQQAVSLFKRVLLSHPMSDDAEMARAKLTALGAESTLTFDELRSLGDAYYNAGHYEQAAEQYHALARRSELNESARNGFLVASAACEYKLKKLTIAQAEALADINDDNGARRLYLLMELARDHDDLAGQKRIVAELETRFQKSQWLAEALYSSGNMYLLRRDFPAAIEYYGYLAEHFSENKNAAAAHWKAGWLSYRLGRYDDAARLFDEQIRLFPNSKEMASALYWRGRIYETVEHKPTLAAANYRTLLRVYQHYFYAQMARMRLNALGDAQPVVQSQLDQIQPPPVPVLDESFPVDSPHLAKARLLANAGLNDYIAREIAADPDSATWSALAEAQIYASYGEAYRAMRSLKRALPSAASASIKSIPLTYWRILFPEAYWSTIKAESAKNNLDPYLVASLIRQESEFNPAAISKANAYGLMQLLPSVGKTMAHEEGTGNFQTFQLLDPVTNIRMGARYLRKTLDKFGGVTDYALAAYNAGDSRVEDWQAAGPYQGMDEFIESIPFTETREYVEAILRYEETYKAIDEYSGSQSKVTVSSSKK